MKILLIGPLPPPHGGISIHVSALWRQLVKSGIPCRAIDPARSGKLSFAFALLVHAMRGWTIHVHANGHNTKSWLLALACGLAGILGRGSVLTLHSGMSVSYLSSPGWRLRLAALTCRLCRSVICVNPEIQRAVLALPVSADKTVVAHACIETSHASVPIQPELLDWMERHQPLLGTALFFRPEYGFDLLLSSVRELRERYPSLGCLVMGSGEDRAAAQKTIEQARLEDHVLLLGDVDHDTCLTLMSRCKVFVRPTREDGDSIAVREALSLGVPVVASRVGTRPAGVILFESDDIQDLISKVEQALGEKRCALASTSGRGAPLLGPVVREGGLYVRS